MMKRFVVLGLKILGGLLVTLIVLLVSATLILNSRSFQQKMLAHATELLEEKLQTKVSIDSIHVDFFKFKVGLYGMDVEDREHRQMLKVERLAVNLDCWGMLRDHFKVTYARLEGVKARLYKPEGSEANFQFVVDAFKSDKAKKKQQKTEEKKDTVDTRLTFEVKDAMIGRIDVVFNKDTFYLEKLTYDLHWTGSQEAKISHLSGKMEAMTKKGPQTRSLSIGTTTIVGKDERQQVILDSLHFTIDNHKPRKNANRPKRGFFDAGHVDVIAHAELLLNHLDLKNDTLNFQLTRFVARDSVTGFNVKDLRLRAGISKGIAHVKDITVQQESTVLKFDSATVVLPSKKKGRKFSFQTSTIKGTTELRDIARPFAPVLKNFKMPLELSVVFSGTDSTLTFRNVHVNTPDKLLTIAADGGIDHLKEKEKLNVHFHVKKMIAKGKVKQEIINQFVVKKMMMKQLDNLGTLTYTGDFNVIWKHELFKGVLGSAVGNMAFNFTIDDLNHYITGHIDTKKIHLGKLLGSKDFGDVGLQADFKVDIDKQRTAALRKKTGGKMPYGTVDALVYEVAYKGVKLKELKVGIKSNGGSVEGSVDHLKSLKWGFDFSFTDIDKVSNVKVKPRLKGKLIDLFKKKSSDEDDKTDKKQTKKKQSTDTKATEEPPKKESFFKRLFKKKKKDESAN